MKDLLEIIGFIFLMYVLVLWATGDLEAKVTEAVQWVDGLREDQEPDTVYVIYSEEIQ